MHKSLCRRIGLNGENFVTKFKTFFGYGKHCGLTHPNTSTDLGASEFKKETAVGFSDGVGE